MTEAIKVALIVTIPLVVGQFVTLFIAVIGAGISLYEFWYSASKLTHIEHLTNSKMDEAQKTISELRLEIKSLQK